MEEMDSDKVEFSIVTALWEPLVQKQKLSAWIDKNTFQDLGTVEDLKNAEVFLRNQK